MRTTSRRIVSCLGAVVALTAVLNAQTPGRLSIDTIYDPDSRADFSGSPTTPTAWLDDDTFLIAEKTGDSYAWMKVDATSGRRSPLFDVARMEAALAALPGVPREEAARVARSRDVVFNPAHTAAIVTIGDDLYLYDFDLSDVQRLTTAPGSENHPTFSPDGRLVAYVRSHDLYVVDTAQGMEKALTTDGNAEILNGTLDWLYQEEIYGRGQFQSFWWSPDSSRIAFLQLDERPVPEFTVVDHIPYRLDLEVTDYPKAGDPNPGVRLGVARAIGGPLTWVDTSAYTPTDLLIVGVGWTPDSQGIVHNVQNREQTWLDLNIADAATGTSRRVLRETSKAWVNNLGLPTWLGDGSFLWLSERSGYKHLYHFRADGTLIRQVTTGRWSIRTFYGVDEQRELAYFAAVERTPIGTDIYRAGLDGTGFTRLSRVAGTHRAMFNPAFTEYVDAWSTVTTPVQVRLHRADGTELRVIDANPVAGLADYRLSEPQFLKVMTRDGVPMDAMMINPPDFDRSHRYPVFQFTYSGPGTAQVLDRWGGAQYMFYQLLAQHDVIVWVLDNRSASLRGVASQWPVYGRLGELELRDLEDGIAWLTQQPYVDASRILLSGWSYGGFMTAYALTHSTSWAAGIVGAPVTDWRDYDSVYTERLMMTPAHNPDGYRETAPRFAAANLHGRLLLIHGTMDDNVHMQNSVQFAYALQKAGKPFQMMIYAKSRHGFDNEQLVKHRQQLMFDFVMEAIGTRVPAADTAAAGAATAAR